MLIMSWLWNAMESDLGGACIFCEQPRRLDTVYDLLSDRDNMARIHQLFQNIANHQMGDKFVAEYFS